MKTFIKIIVVILFLYANTLCSQVVTFQKVYGGNGYDYGYSVIQTYDKGYAVAGASSSFGSGNTDAYVLKTDSLGNPLWHKTYGGINIDQAYSIQETPDSGLIIAGYTNSFGQGGYDMYVIKTNKQGDTMWTKTYGGTDWDFAYSIEQTNDKGYILTGGTYSYGSGNQDMYLVKIDSLGDTLWTKTFGGINDDEARKVKQTNDSGYIITGYTKSFGDSNGDIYTVKTDSIGDTLWTFKYQGFDEDNSYDVLQDHLGTGYTVGGKSKLILENTLNGIILKISNAGSLISVDTLFGDTLDNVMPKDDYISAIDQSPDGRFAILGNTQTWGNGNGTYDYMFHVINPYDGWHGHTWGGVKNDIANDFSPTTDGGYIICGNSPSYSNLDHIFLIKTDSNTFSSTGNPDIIITSIANISKEDDNFQMYPNPADEKINVPIPESHLFTFSINNVLGQSFYCRHTINYSLNCFEIDTHYLPNGLYFFILKEKNSTSVKQFIISH